MKKRIEVKDKFSIKDCLDNPDKYYIFGDNLIHQGTGGQAIIRSCHNAIGIPTKRLPNMDDEAFFNDQPEESNKVLISLNRLLLLYNSKEKPILVFPKNGLGTGRAKLKEKSPKIYDMIDNFLKTHFELEIMP